MEASMWGSWHMIGGPQAARCDQSLEFWSHSQIHGFMGAQTLATFRKSKAAAESPVWHLQRPPAVRSPVSSTRNTPALGSPPAKSIFAWLGSSVGIKRLFAVTNVANSDQAI